MTKKTKAITGEMRKNADIQINELQREIKYDTKDYTVEVIFIKWGKGDIIIPDYQRRFIWSEKNQASFIESVLLGLPIPFMFFGDCEEDGKLEVIDGAQRVQTLVKFISNKITIPALPKLASLKGFKFSDLSEVHRRRFLNRSIRVVVLDNTTASDIRQEIFNRINTSGVKINDSEVRRGSYPGKLANFIDQLCKDSLFVKLCPVPDEKENRYERFELVLRFLAYTDAYLSFDHRVSIFLDDFMKKHQDTFDEKAYSDIFNDTMRFVEKHFPNGFAKSQNASSTPRVRFEAIAVGSALALQKAPQLAVNTIEWINSEEFKEFTTSDGSNNQGRLKERVEYVRDQLLKDAVND
jgi:hypothetical protein